MKRLIAIIALCLLVLTTLFTALVFAQQDSNVEKVIQSNNQSAIDLYKKIKTEKDNIFFSPYSISTALALTFGGARGETAKQMATVLHFSLENEELHSAFAYIQTRLNAMQQKKKIELHIANSLWPQDKYLFLNEYLELAKNVYQAEITPVDYENNPESARQKINSWVERKTNNRIKDIIDFKLDRVTRLILANAIYFKGEWVSQFERPATEIVPFHLDLTATTKVPMMHQTNDLNYGEGDVLRILEMPYAGLELSMLIALPTEIDGLQKLEEMLTLESLREWSKNSHKRPVDVYFPRFEMTFQFDLKNVLIAMGMTHAFASGKADFSGMDGNPNWSYIAYAVHKAFVEVNEEGTEAAAATVGGGCFPTGTEVLTASGPRPIETVNPGTKVYACDLATGKWILTSVLKRQSYQYEGDIITIQMGAVSIQATGNHPFYVLRGERLASRPIPQDVPQEEQGTTESGRWVEARDLKEGDMLKDKSGEGLIITSLASRQEKTEVYNLDVESYHNYSVQQKGILVHNKGGIEAKPVLFRADHPFLFLIRDNITGSILFIGRVANPSRK